MGSSGVSDYCLLGLHVIDIPSIQRRAQRFFERESCGTFCPSEAASLLHALESEDAKLVTWPLLREHRRPYKSLPLHHCTDQPSDQPLYPKRIDIYRDGTVANMINAWRLIRSIHLIRISRVARLLAQHSTLSFSTTYIATAIYADTAVREHIDDICCRYVNV